MEQKKITNVEIKENDKKFQFLLKSISQIKVKEDKINYNLIDQYVNCAPLFQTFNKNVKQLSLENINEILNSLHSLKGNARTIGFFKLGAIYHKLESIFIYMKDSGLPIEQSFAQVQNMLIDLGNQAAYLHMNYLEGKYNISLKEIQSSSESPIQTNQLENHFSVKEKVVSQLVEQIIQSKVNNQELFETSSTIKKDSLDLKRLMEMRSLDYNELVFHVNRFLSNLDSNMNTIGQTLSKQDKQNSAIMEDILKVRLVSVSQYSDVFYETMRNTCAHYNKKCKMDIVGEHIQIDKVLMDKISFAIEHLIRNSVVHGIENGTERIKRGKPAIGSIFIKFTQMGNFIHISFSDDGRGIQVNKLQERLSILRPNLNTQSFQEKDWYQTIFYSGLTTRDDVDEYSGRGIGLDSVKQTVINLSGQITVDESSSYGTIFNLHLPLNQVVSNLTVIKNNGLLYAIPNITIDTILTIDKEFYENNLKNKEFVDLSMLLSHYSGKVFKMPEYNKTPCISFGHLINDPVIDTGQKRYNVMVLNYLDSKAILLIDEIYSTNIESIIEGCGSLQNTAGVLGACMISKDESALVINPILLMDNYTKDLKNDERKAYVLIVDDSKVACMSIEQSLKKIGMYSISRSDGQEAYQYLQSNLDYLPMIILTDFEMPNMNGLELSKAIKNNESLKDLPIVMITSKSLETYRQEAQQVGIIKLMPKPFNERELLSIIKGL